jgi:hypothetical protein
MNVNLAKTAGTTVDKLVRHQRPDEEDLAGLGFDRLRTYGEPWIPFQHDEDLLIRMTVESRTLACRKIYEDEAHACSSVVDALQLRVRKVVAIDNQIVGRQVGSALALHSSRKASVTAANSGEVTML